VLWDAYHLVEAARVHGDTQRERIADLVSLIRFAVSKESDLVPFAEVVNERFAKWLADQQAAGRNFTPDQIAWLELIRDHVGASLSVEADDLEQVPFTELGGLGAAYDVFGDELYDLLAKLNEVLV
jgi:type I restriction enzyme R subunit